MQSILVVGAGREGKGFLGETFSTDGWQVYFLDKDPGVVNALKTGKYNVTVYQENGTFKRGKLLAMKFMAMTRNIRVCLRY